MAEDKFDQILKIIARGNSLYKIPESELDDEVLEKLIQDRLVRKNGEGGYSLTGYGEIIVIMGYKEHEKQKGRSKSAEKRIDKKWVALLVILLILVSGGVFMIV